jgi:predicted dehydrogenase
VEGHRATMLGTGLIGLFYTQTLHGGRGRDRVQVVYSRSPERAEAFAREHGVPNTSTDLEDAIAHPNTDVVVVGLPNHLHEEAIELCARHGKAVLCTKPLARTAEEAKRILDTVERAGIFAGYLEDLVYTPKTLKAVQAVQAGQIGAVTWARSRETHPGPHSAWFWDAEQAGGGAIVDLGCHCIEIIRNFMGKENRPLEAFAWTDTLVHPIEAEDNAVALIKFESGAIGQFEVSWTFRGGMDLRDEVAGTEGTIWTNHFLRTGFEMFSSGEGGGYVAEKAETASGWLFPVGDEVTELGYVDMFRDMFDALDEGRQPMETFYDGYVVNAVMDACYAAAKSGKWEPVQLDDWRGRGVERIARTRREHDGKTVIKEEKMPDGRRKLILKDESTGEFLDVVTEIEEPITA